MTKYYLYYNATRRVKSGDFEFAFDPIEQFGGSWKGILKESDPARLAELQKLAGPLGFSEITEEQYEAMLKKKVRLTRFSANIPISPLQPDQIKVVPVVVKNPTGVSIEPKVPEPGVTSDNAISVGKASYTDPLSDRTRPHFVRSWQ